VSASLKWKGVDQLVKNLKDSGPQIARKVGDSGLRAGARVIVKEAKRLAPKGATGDLRKSITAIIARPEKEDTRVAKIGWKPPVSRRAHFSEFGTSKTPAKPHLRPAMDSQAGAALEAMRDQMARDLNKAEWKSLVRAFRNLVDTYVDEGIE
jgi:HK97 gp10 family phage protein